VISDETFDECSVFRIQTIDVGQKGNVRSDESVEGFLMIPLKSAGLIFKSRVADKLLNPHAGKDCC
jgi:hypothetical protein